MANPSHIDSKNQVKRILEVLSRHSDVLSDALDGHVDLGDRGYNTGVDALVEINALMPIEEGQYNLNPRLRAFLSDQLATYSAFQTLTRITEQIMGAKAKWSQIQAMKSAGDMQDMPALEASMGYTIAEIVQYTNSNVTLLHTQIETDFGNVSSFRLKLGQNRFYGEGVKTMIAELKQLEAFTQEIERDSIGMGLFTIRQIVHARINAWMPLWISRLNDIQGRISNNLFAIRQLEQNLRYLSRMVLWLAKNPTRQGLDVEPDETVLPVLVRPIAIEVRPQIVVAGLSKSDQEVLDKSVARLPPERSPWVREAPMDEPQYVDATVMQEVDEPVAPEDQLIDALVDHLDARKADEVSVLEWMRPEREALGLSGDVWLLYVANQLTLLGIQMEFMMAPRQPGDLNDTFVDVVAFAEDMPA